MEKAYEAYLEYVVWRYANPNATFNDELLTQWRLAHSYVLDPEQKAYMSAWCWQFDKHGRQATAEADRSERPPCDGCKEPGCDYLSYGGPVGGRPPEPEPETPHLRDRWINTHLTNCAWEDCKHPAHTVKEFTVDV